MDYLGRKPGRTLRLEFELEEPHRRRSSSNRKSQVLKFILVLVSLLNIILVLYLKFRDTDSTGLPNIQPHPLRKYAHLAYGDVYAHKILIMDHSDEDTTTESKRYKLKIIHTNNDGNLEISKGVRLLPWGIQVRQPGHYYIYKSVYFTAYSRDMCGRLEHQIFDSILLLNQTQKQRGVSELLKTEHTCCPTCKDNSEAAFAGEIFKLEAEDIVQVEVIGKNFVDIQCDLTYIGLMMLAKQDQTKVKILE